MKTFEVAGELKRPLALIEKPGYGVIDALHNSALSFPVPRKRGCGCILFKMAAKRSQGEYCTYFGCSNRMYDAKLVIEQFLPLLVFLVEKKFVHFGKRGCPESQGRMCWVCDDECHKGL